MAQESVDGEVTCFFSAPNRSGVLENEKFWGGQNSEGKYEFFLKSGDYYKVDSPASETHGEKYSSNGDFFKGDLKDDKFDGWGHAITNDGNHFIGEFKDNVMHGLILVLLTMECTEYHLGTSIGNSTKEKWFEKKRAYETRTYN